MADIGQYIFYISVSVLMLIPLIVSIYQSFIKGISSNKLNAFFRLGSIAGFSISQITFTILLILSDIHEINITEDTQILLTVVANVLWICSEYMLLLYFVNRFYYAFIDYPQCQLSMRKYNIFYFGATIYLSIQLATNANLLCIYHGVYGFYEANVIAIIQTLTSLTVHIVLNCYMLHSFTKNIIRLIISIWQQNKRPINTASELEDKLLDQVTKYFILLSLSIFSTFIFLIASATPYGVVIYTHGDGFWWYPNDESLPILSLVSNCAWQIDCLCKAYCIFFERDYAKQYYTACGKMWCRVHLKTRQMFSNSAEDCKVRDLKYMALKESQGRH